MTTVRCLGCHGDYELAEITEHAPLCPLCGERHPFDDAAVDPESENTIVFSRWMGVVAVLAVIGVVVVLLLPQRGQRFSGAGQADLPAGPFEAKAPWVLRWECERPPTIYLYRHVEGEDEPQLARTIGDRVPVPRIGEEEMKIEGTFEVRINPLYNGPWTFIVFD